METWNDSYHSLTKVYKGPFEICFHVSKPALCQLVKIVEPGANMNWTNYSYKNEGNKKNEKNQPKKWLPGWEIVDFEKEYVHALMKSHYYVTI